jgi:hypothetical protein
MSDPPKLIDESETAEGITRIYSNGLMETTTKEGAYLDVPYLVEGKRRAQNLGLNKRFYVLADAQGFYRISRRARALLATKDYSDHIAAIAVVKTHLFIKLVLELFFQLDKPATPTKAFTNKADALRWLKERMALDKKGRSPSLANGDHI